jgi:hypothetical protein
VEVGPDHHAAGEDVRIADRTRHPELASLTVDFWLFDDERVLRLDYSPEGAFLGSRQITDRVMVDRYRWERFLAVGCSVPLQEFLLPA